MKRLFAILAVALLVVACGGQKTEDKAAEETINGLVPGADYLVYTNGWKNVMTFYNDGTAVSSLSGDCVWSYESIKDQSFVEVEIIENYGTYYIDENQNLYVDNVNSKGSKMERINYIPKNAKGMVVGKLFYDAAGKNIAAAVAYVCDYQLFIINKSKRGGCSHTLMLISL